MAEVEPGGLSGPVDGKVELADLGQSLGGVLQPGRHLPVTGVGSDDRVNVLVPDGEPTRVPLHDEPGVILLQTSAPGGPVRAPQVALLLVGELGAELGGDLVQLRPIGGQAWLAESGSVADRIDLEEVALVVELEADHPVDKLAIRRRRGARQPRVQLEQLSDRVPDDAAGVVGAHDHLAGTGDRLLGDGEYLCRRLVLGRVLQQGHRVVQLKAVLVRGPPAVEVSARPHQGKNLVSQGHGHILPVARCAKAGERSTIGETEDDLRYSRADVPVESVSGWTSGQSTRQQPQTRLPSARIRSASLLQEQPGFRHSHRTPRSISSAITFTRLRRHVRGHHLSSPPTPDVLLRFFDVTMPSRDDVPM